jgi:hypothetical protein
MLVKGNVWVPDSSFEADLWRLEWVVGWKDKEEFEFSALLELLVTHAIVKSGGCQPDMESLLVHPLRYSSCGRFPRQQG